MVKTSRSDLRKFGLSVGSAFVGLAAVSRYRGHDVAPYVLATLGVLLIVPGALAPGALGPVRSAWMRAAGVVGHFNTQVILGIFFYLVLTPLGFVMRLVRDPLNRSMKDGSTSNWTRRERKPVDPASYQHQF